MVLIRASHMHSHRRMWQASSSLLHTLFLAPLLRECVMQVLLHGRSRSSRGDALVRHINERDCVINGTHEAIVRYVLKTEHWLKEQRIWLKTKQQFKTCNWMSVEKIIIYSPVQIVQIYYTSSASSGHFKHVRFPNHFFKWLFHKVICILKNLCTSVKKARIM